MEDRQAGGTRKHQDEHLFRCRWLSKEISGGMRTKIDLERVLIDTIFSIIFARRAEQAITTATQQDVKVRCSFSSTNLPSESCLQQEVAMECPHSVWKLAMREMMRAAFGMRMGWFDEKELEDVKSFILTSYEDVAQEEEEANGSLACLRKLLCCAEEHKSLLSHAQQSFAVKVALSNISLDALQLHAGPLLQMFTQPSGFDACLASFPSCAADGKNEFVRRLNEIFRTDFSQEVNTTNGNGSSNCDGVFRQEINTNNNSNSNNNNDNNSGLPESWAST